MYGGSCDSPSLQPIVSTTIILPISIYGQQFVSARLIPPMAISYCDVTLSDLHTVLAPRPLAI